MHFCVWLLWINITSVRTIRAVSGSSWFTLLVKGIPVLDVLRFLICFPADGLGCFAVRATIRSAAVTILVHVLSGAHGCFSVGHTLRNGIAGPWCICIFCFLLQFLKDHLEGRKIPMAVQAPQAIEGICLR